MAVEKDLSIETILRCALGTCVCVEILFVAMVPNTTYRRVLNLVVECLSSHIKSLAILSATRTWS